MMLPMAMHSDPDERDDGPSDEDVERFSAPVVRMCQECGAEVSEESDICPKCRAYQFDEDEPRKRPKQATLNFALVVAVLLVALALSGLLIVFVR